MPDESECSTVLCCCSRERKKTRGARGGCRAGRRGRGGPHASRGHTSAQRATGRSTHQRRHRRVALMTRVHEKKSRSRQRLSLLMRAAAVVCEGGGAIWADCQSPAQPVLSRRSLTLSTPCYVTRPGAYLKRGSAGSNSKFRPTTCYLGLILCCWGMWLNNIAMGQIIRYSECSALLEVKIKFS
jgi:hypothetical protein